MVKEMTNGAKQKKAPSKKQMKKVLENSVNIKDAWSVIYKGDDFRSIYFADLGMGIYVCKDFVIATTNFHQHIWNRFTGTGLDYPVVFLTQLVDIANEHGKDISDKNERGEKYHSMGKLISLDTLTEAERKIITITSNFLYLVNANIHALNLEPFDMAMFNIKYSHWLSMGEVMMNNDVNDMPLNDFNGEVIKNMRFLCLNAEFEKTDELRAKINEIEDKALSDIKSFVEANGGKVFDDVKLPKREGNEVEALNELQS